MHPHGNHDGRVKTGSTGWISIHINDADGLQKNADNPEAATPVPPDFVDLFRLAQRAPLPWPERFPRLTFVAIAIALLITALTAEFDYLRGAGYFWP